MADLSEARDTVLNLIVDAASVEPPTGTPGDRIAVHRAKAEAILKLSEAYAWLSRQDAPH